MYEYHIYYRVGSADSRYIAYSKAEARKAIYEVCELWGGRVFSIKRVNTRTGEEYMLNRVP